MAEPEDPELIGYGKYIWHYIVKEGSVIRRAPFSFVTAMLVIGVPLFLFTRSQLKEEYSQEVEDLKSANERLNATAQSLQASLELDDRKISELNTKSGSVSSLGNSRVQAIRYALSGAYPVHWAFYFVNKGAAPAQGLISAHKISLSDGLLPHESIDSIFKDLKDKIKDLENRHVSTELQPGDSGVVSIDGPDITEKTFSSYKSGHGYAYVCSLLEYRDEDVPVGKWRVTEVCQFGKATEIFQNCEQHNRIFISD